MKVGILGGGQLGRMLALAGYPLDIRCTFLDPSPDAPVGHLAELLVGAYDDPALLDRLAADSDVVTYEFENVPARAAARLMERVPVFPPPIALDVAQDRLGEKQLFQQLSIPTPRFTQVDSEGDLASAISELGFPAVLKTRRLGYDGKGHAVLRRSDDVSEAWAALGGRSLILEHFVLFKRELSILAVRGRDGSTRFYPLVENHHHDGILRISLAPAPESESLQSVAEQYAGRLLDALGGADDGGDGSSCTVHRPSSYVGVLTVELFQTADGLLANEIAPRVHNSGHWTIEGAKTSQFENHLRAILGLPLGPTEGLGHSAMANLIGEIPDPASILAIHGAHLHLYGKTPRPGRKLGHVTLRDDDSERVGEHLAALQELVAT